MLSRDSQFRPGEKSLGDPIGQGWETSGRPQPLPSAIGQPVSRSGRELGKAPAFRVIAKSRENVMLAFSLRRDVDREFVEWDLKAQTAGFCIRLFERPQVEKPVSLLRGRQGNQVGMLCRGEERPGDLEIRDRPIGRFDVDADALAGRNSACDEAVGVRQAEMETLGASRIGNEGPAVAASFE